MIQIKRLAGRGSLLLVALAFGAVTVVPALFSGQKVAAAGMPTNRSISLSSDQLGTNTADANGTAYAAGAGGNGQKAFHTVKFTLATASIVNSMAITYCTTPFVETPCVAPTGMTTTLTSATVTNGFTTTTGTQMALDTSTVANTGYFNFGGSNPCGGTTPFRNNCILLKRGTATSTADTAGTNINLTFGNSGTNYITNPTSATTYYIRIATFSDSAYTTGNVVDEGAAAFAIIGNTIDISSKVQEQLTFSVGVTATSPGSTCAALAGGGTLAVGDTNGALNTTTPYDGRSYWRVYTNANNGTVILYSADTLKTTTGYSITAASSSGATIAAATEAFGLGLDSTDTTPAGAGTGYTLSTLNRFPTAAAPDVYGGANGTVTSAKVGLNTGSVTTPQNLVTQSAAAPINCETGAMRYIASASTTTKPGIYRTSVTYIATPTF